MSVPKVHLIGEPDDNLKSFLSICRMERVGPTEDVDLIIYPKLLQPKKTNVVVDLDRHLGADPSRFARKPVILFAFNDFEIIIKCKSHPTIVYRTGVSRFWKLPNEFVLPFLWIDQPGTFNIRGRRDKPVVGFCGTLLRRRSRRVTLNRFRADGRFLCEFIIRDKFNAEGLPPDEAARAFVENIENADFVVCDRGRGNWTIRIYEALSRGRIPVLYDTGGALPTIGAGTWDDAIVTARTRRTLIARTMQVWRGDLEARQAYCRSVWADNFSVNGFANRFSDDILSLMATVRGDRDLCKYSLVQRIFFIIRYLIFFSRKKQSEGAM